MEIVKKKSRSAKRLIYECAGQITIGNEMDEARLTNISASGIQFETPNRIHLNTKVQLLWTDPTLGILNPEQTQQYCSMMVERYPSLLFDFHAHNDYDLAVVGLTALAPLSGPEQK